MVDDAAAAFVVRDVGEEVDVAVQPAESDGDVEWAAADVLAEDLAIALDDVDQRLADDERPTHDWSLPAANASSVARAPSRCNESNAHR